MNIVVFGTGIEFAHVKSLSKDYKVIYYTDYISPFPKFSEYATGVGFDNIEKTHTPYTSVSKDSLLCTFDVYYSDLFQYYKDNGYKVFGGGISCKLELDRKILKQTLDILKIPTPKYRVVKGFDNIKPPCVVKISYFRGSIETFVITDNQTKEALRYKLYSEFGSVISNMEFIVEDIIDDDVVEVGIDGIFNNGFVFPMLFGVEYKKGCYVGKVINSITELPKPIQETVYKLEQLLKRNKYVGFISTEEFMTKDKKKHWFLDITVRAPYPLSLGYPYWIKNYNDVIVKGSKPIFKGEYVVAVPFEVKETTNQFLPITFPENDERYQFESLVKTKQGYLLPKQEQPVSGVVCEVFNILDPKYIEKTMTKLLDKVNCYSLTSDISNLRYPIEVLKDVVTS